MHELAQRALAEQRETSVTDPTQNPVVVGSEAIRQGPFKTSYDGSMPEIMALHPSKLLRQNVDAGSLVNTMMGALPEVLKYQAECAETFPRSDNRNFTNLERRARAFAYANVLHKIAIAPKVPVQQLSDALLRKRAVIEAEVRAWAARGVVDKAALEAIPGIQGYNNQALGLLAVTALARGALASMAGKTTVTSAELDEAEIAADELLGAVGERDQQPAAELATADIKVRAYTLAVLTYDAIRRDITHLRWDHGDVDEIVPSLRSKLSKRRATEAKNDEPEQEPEVDASASSHASGVVPAITAPEADVPPGMPGANPFIKTSKG